MCEKNKRKEWFLRIMCETAYCDFSKFVTLTYSEENVPLVATDEGLLGTLNHEDYKDFVKRLRKNLGEIKIKYYMCGEYGETQSRPHYHVVMLFYGDISRIDLRVRIERAWRLGYVQIGTVTPRSVMYCLKYMRKMNNINTNQQIKKPYQRVSQGLGLDFLKENENLIIENGYIAHNLKKYPVPRYFRKKSEKLDQKFKETLSSEDFASYEESLYENYAEKQKDKSVSKTEQVKRNYEAREKIAKRKI